jgi:hypothetical protein
MILSHARVLVPPKPGCDRSGIRGMLTVGQSLDRAGCWGEGEDATLRSMPSSPRYTNEDLARASRGGRPSSSPLQDEGKALTKSASPTSSSRPEAHVGFGPL